ncbi:cyclic lactone autoinducer peptide [Cohnella yongneupensis]|uniref:Cyclic lactone autoinducer peptide n=1 Tax=Cohnella yongneupensis TaxID=425006 RepID=A0ABW0QYT5_9BACL
MKNQVTKKAVVIVSRMLAVVAVAFVSTASMWVLHRPNTPAELKSKK